ncbi:MAG: glycoside hydrolase family 2, partial [Candidatus Omnitrophica bacterium]|nr:glycoside hydrolase family 2 [Candidatus Omnitrophota bacterium]
MALIAKGAEPEGIHPAQNSQTAWNTEAPIRATKLISLDGTWQLAVDPKNVGREEKWWESCRPEAKETKVPWVIQDAFPEYHGVAWYWKGFTAPMNPNLEGRYLLRFWAVDYLADVWVNGVHAGSHEGAETPFVIDVSSAIKPGETNLIAVRVLNVSNDRIDGMVLAEVPHRHKGIPYRPGAAADHGGITDSVELLVAPVLRFTDLVVRPDIKTGRVSLEVSLHNASPTSIKGHLTFSIAPATTGESLAVIASSQPFEPGDTVVKQTLAIDQPRLWQLNDPFLYRVTARVVWEDGRDEQSTRCGFRDFRFADGYFRLNGKRIFLRSSHSCNHFPVGLQVPGNPDFARRDLIYAKMAGFNCIRFIAGMPTRDQLDLCDELGLMVYEENYASWCLGDSPKMAERYDRSFTEMIRRDRNHPSIVIWGMLNETGDGPVFRHAVACVPMVRALDPARMLILNSGRTDRQINIGSICNPGSMQWECLLGAQGPHTEPARPTPLCGYLEGVGDAHCYPRVPQTQDTIRFLRTLGQGTQHAFLSEYGVGSAVNWLRIYRQFEQMGKTEVEDARFYKRIRDLFLADWERFNLADTFASPDDYLQRCIAKMASQRLEGLNALRSNPNLAGYSMTGTMDQGMTGEGLWTLFRELKPGTMDALFEGWAPLRMCLFANPEHIYRKTPLELEAVLANEDALKPGNYPVRIQIVGPDGLRILDRVITLSVPDPESKPEPPFALPVFSERITVDGPTGKYRFLATLEKGGAPTGGGLTFYVTDPADMPDVPAEVVLWGNDINLASWLKEHNINCRQFSPTPQSAREVILAGPTPNSGDASAWCELARHIARGSSVIFLCPEVFARGNQAGYWLPLEHKGAPTVSGSDLYIRDEWAKHHPIFQGLPSGGLMDYTYYRELIPDPLWTGQDPPEEVVAGGIRAAIHPSGYASGSMISVYRLAAGRFILNTMAIRQNLGVHPAAETATPGLFGLVGMRERVEELGGK